MLPLLELSESPEFSKNFSLLFTFLPPPEKILLPPEAV
jgi:hypothetical protein